MCKDGFYFFENYRAIAKDLPEELRLKFYDGLMGYVFEDIEPDDCIIKALITAIKPSLDKVEKRGGNHNPTGQNQHTKGQKEVKSVQSCSKEVKDSSKEGQSGQSFNKQETRNIKQETRNNIIISSDKSSDMIVKNDDFDLLEINKVLSEFQLPNVRDLTDERKTKLKQRCISVGGFDNFLNYIRVALVESSFLRGNNKSGWRADFDFFLQKSSWQKVIEGKYKDVQAVSLDEKNNQNFREFLEMKGFRQ